MGPIFILLLGQLCLQGIQLLLQIAVGTLKLVVDLQNSLNLCLIGQAVQHLHQFFVFALVCVHLLFELVTLDLHLLVVRLQLGVAFVELFVHSGEGVQFEEGLLQVFIGVKQFVLQAMAPRSFKLRARVCWYVFFGEDGHVLVVVAETADFPFEQIVFRAQDRILNQITRVGLLRNGKSVVDIRNRRICPMLCSFFRTTLTQTRVLSSRVHTLLGLAATGIPGLVVGTIRAFSIVIGFLLHLSKLTVCDFN